MALWPRPADARPPLDSARLTREVEAFARERVAGSQDTRPLGLAVKRVWVA